MQLQFSELIGHDKIVLLHILSAAPLLGSLPSSVAHLPHPPDLAAQRAGHTGLLSSGNRTFHDVHVLGALSLVVFVFGELLYTFFSELGMNVAEPHR